MPLCTAWNMTTAKSNSQRQQAFRDRKRQEGLKLLRLYVRPEWIPTIDALIDKLQENEK
jgi:hypothetical protein